MDPKFWHERWEKGQIGFHMDQPHPNLVQFFSGREAGKVLVPLCGKSPDLLWLRQQGHTVVGVELSALACEAFFRENNLTFETRQAGSFQVFEGGGITLWCGDFFAAPAEIWTDTRYVYDRAALIALPTELRKKYAHHLRTNWSGGYAGKRTLLLITLSCDPDQTLGPPFSVPEAEVHQHYASYFEIELLLKEQDADLSGQPPRFEHTAVFENTYLLRSR